MAGVGGGRSGDNEEAILAADFVGVTGGLLQAGGVVCCGVSGMSLGWSTSNDLSVGGGRDILGARGVVCSWWM